MNAENETWVLFVSLWGAMLGITSFLANSDNIYQYLTHFIANILCLADTEKLSYRIIPFIQRLPALWDKNMLPFTA